VHMQFSPINHIVVVLCRNYAISCHVMPLLERIFPDSGRGVQEARLEPKYLACFWLVFQSSRD
jgi:hypothetical protein